MTSVADTGRRRAAPALGTFERYLTVWVALCIIAGIVLVDIGVQAGHVANQSRIYALVPSARARLNTFYMVAFFAGGALGSYCGPLGFTVGGWAGFCAFPLAALALALVYFVRAERNRSSADERMMRLSRSG